MSQRKHSAPDDAAGRQRPATSEDMAGEDRDDGHPAPEPPQAQQPAVDQPAVAGASAQLAEQTGLPEDLARLQDQLLRARAELDNYRKRAAREIESERRYACVPLMRDLLGVLDNLELASQAAEQHENASALLEGVQMVLTQLHSVLEQHHCRRIEADGKPFDPHCHEAMLQQPSDEHPAGYVIRVAREGYQLHDRVIRPSQVHVSSGPPPLEQRPS